MYTCAAKYREHLKKQCEEELSPDSFTIDPTMFRRPNNWLSLEKDGLKVLVTHEVGMRENSNLYCFAVVMYVDFQFRYSSLAHRR